ncbi:NUDIX domain-containing protein [Halomarina ordinaria]|uniref:NUDIX domain-containing protein n=1 Tax=Halomarina ordinaria TaxID=3033939 RepID=A0ABD5UCB3_9EURY|nr:NUDIX domain-containing protein [Halomarina sp. PSRA2]
MAASESQESVSAHLSALDDVYDGFAVSQTTVPVRPAVYDRLASLGTQSVVDAAVRVRNAEDQVLAVKEGGEGWTDPYGAVERDETIESGARRCLRERTGIDASLDELLSVTILCLTDADDPDREPLYRLAALFSGTHVTGDPAAECECAWRARPPRSSAAL